MSNNNLHLAFAFYTTTKNPAALLVQISEGGPVMNRAGLWVNPPVLTPALDVAPSLSDAQHHMLDFLAAKEAAEVAKAAAERDAFTAALAALAAREAAQEARTKAFYAEAHARENTPAAQAQHATACRAILAILGQKL